MMISEKQRGHLFVLVGPGGAGKNTLMKPLLKRVPHLHKLVTATTRAMRANEKHGEDHYFVSSEEFEQLFANQQLLEREEVTPGKHYGIIKYRIDEKLDNKLDLIADIDVNGAQKLRAAYPDDVVLIFITVPGATLEEKLKTLRQRMEDRQENAEEIENRLTRARMEFLFADECDYVIENEDLQKAEKEVHAIIETHRQKRQSL
jgi:guanylate kinase